MVTPVPNSPTTAAPARGTRPKDRRLQIRSAAAKLFYERGYEQVSIAEVAESVNVGPSALYRHFTGKADLLYEAIDMTINAFSAMVAELPTRDLDGIALTAARTALAYRALGVLWQREARNLDPEHQQVLRLRLRTATETLAGTLREVRPDLSRDQAVFLASAEINAMCSISFHRLTLPSAEYESVLVELALRILRYQFGRPRPPRTSPATPSKRRVTRRDQISDVAAALFAQRGFDAVSIDDIGAAVGIAGPSLYHHFASKQDLLYDSIRRGHALLQHALADALERGGSPEPTLRQVSDSYVDLALGHSDLITNLIAEVRNLGPDYAETVQRAQLGYIGQWVALVQAIRPEEDLTVSRIKVQAAQMTANSLARTAYLRDRPGFDDDVAELCWLLQQ